MPTGSAAGWCWTQNDSVRRCGVWTVSSRAFPRRPWRAFLRITASAGVAPGRFRPALRQHADADVAEGDLVAVVLQGDVAAARAAVARHLPELAGGDALLPLRAAELVFQQLFAVEPVLHVVAAHHQPPLVPLAGRARYVTRGGVQGEVAAGGGVGL